MKYILSMVLSFIAGCLVIVNIYNYKEVKTVINEETRIKETNSLNPSINKVYNSVLTVIGYTNSDSISTVGSSFVYKVDEEYAYILTNYHVIKGLNKIEVKNIEEVVKTATVVGFDEYKDIAILKTDKSIALSTAEFGDSSTSLLGDTVFTVGSPLTEEYYGTVTKGIISYKNRLIKSSVSDEVVLINTIQTNTTINPGNSGGPLVNLSGEVIGVVSSKVILDETEGLAFAIPINDIKPILETLENGQVVPRLKTNMEVVDLNNTYELYKNGLYLEQEYDFGIYIKRVEENSIFKDVLKDDDIVLKINNKNIKNTLYFEYFINEYDNIKLEIKRDNEIINLDFTK